MKARDRCKRPAPFAAVILAAIYALLPGPTGAEPSHTEYDVKAAFIYNFATLVEWPSSAFPSDTAPHLGGGPAPGHQAAQ